MKKYYVNVPKLFFCSCLMTAGETLQSTRSQTSECITKNEIEKRADHVA